MSEYQAIYDAVRSRISNADVGAAVSEAIRTEVAGASWAIEAVKAEALTAFSSAARPSVLYRPTLGADGTKWCALYGDDLQSGLAGFGDTPAEAMEAFDKAWATERTPAVLVAAYAAAPAALQPEA